MRHRRPSSTPAIDTLQALIHLAERDQPVERTFEAATALVVTLNRQLKTDDYVAFAAEAIGPSFLRAYERYVQYSETQLKYHRLLELWIFAVESRNTLLLDWVNQCKHVFERTYLRGDPIEAAVPSFGAAFLKHNSEIDMPEVRPVFVCAMPKSGSTSFTTILAGYLGRTAKGGHNRNALVHGLEIDYLRPLIRTGAVIHSHLRPSLDLMCILRALRVPPIVIFRNIFDVIEARIHADRNLVHHTIFSSPEQLEIQLSLEHAIDRYAYEYLSFAQQWMKVSEMAPVGIFHFEDNISDWHGTLRRCSELLGCDYDADKADAILSAYEQSRKDAPEDYRIVGSTGRSRQSYTPDLVERVQALTRYFPGTDFSRIMTPPKSLAG